MRCALQGLLEFLAYEPFYDSRIWSSLVLRRGEAGPERLAPLCSLLRGVMLRRTKDSVGAPRQAHLSERPAAATCVKDAHVASMLLCQHGAHATTYTVTSGSRLQPMQYTDA